MTPDNPVVQTVTPIKFVLTPSHFVPTTSKLVITFPTAYTLPASCTVTPISSNVATSGASCLLVNGNLEVTKFLSAGFNPTSPLDIQFKLSGI